MEELPEQGGRRIIARRLPASWPAERYFESQLGADQARYTPSGGIIFNSNVKDDSSGKFSYNKDVHAGINAIFLLNTTTGEISELVGAAASAPAKPASPGVANTPRLSHDGRTLAFVRRVKEKSVLVLKDMLSGTIHRVWDELTHDLSLIPGFMGAYPSYGWSADDQTIIIWSQGHIWSIPIELSALGERVASNEQPQKLVFKPPVDLALGDTCYSETQIQDMELGDHVQVRSLRGLRSDRRGTRVVFEAAGDNVAFDLHFQSLMELPKLKAEDSCYNPSFITGSEWVVQACWHNGRVVKKVN